MSEGCASSETQEAPAPAEPQRYPGYREGYSDHYRGGPDRTSPRRRPRAMVATAAMADMVASIVFPEPGSRFDPQREKPARPRTKITAIHSTIPMRAPLKGALFEITAEADLDGCAAEWLSYETLAHRLGCDRRTAIGYVAELESWAVVRTERRAQRTEAGKIRYQPCRFILQRPPWLEPLASSVPPLPPEVPSSSSSSASTSPPAKTSPPVSDGTPPSSSAAVDAGAQTRASSPPPPPPAPPAKEWPPAIVERVAVHLSALSAAADRGEELASPKHVAVALQKAAANKKNAATLCNAIDYTTKKVVNRALAGIRCTPVVVFDLLDTAIASERSVPELVFVKAPTAPTQNAATPKGVAPSGVPTTRAAALAHLAGIRNELHQVAHPASLPDWEKLSRAEKNRRYDAYEVELEQLRQRGPPTT